MRKNCIRLGLWLMLLLTMPHVDAQTTPKLQAAPLLGKWEVMTYPEQGVQVDKKQDPLAQAIKVYGRIKNERARRYYGFDPETETIDGRRERAFERWSVKDSTLEVTRITKAIAMPYFVVFFPDSTVSMYNLDASTGEIANVQVKQYWVVQDGNSLHMKPAPYQVPMAYWPIQIVALTEQEMTLFLPEIAGIVTLRRRTMTLP